MQKLFYLVALIVGVIMTTSTHAQSLDLSEGWIKVNDNVMGGVSSSQVFMQDDALHFQGQLSLANNGGFVSIRRILPEDFFQSTSAVCVTYKINPHRQFQLRLMGGHRFDGIAYRSLLSGNGQWQTVALQIESFIPVFRGRVLTGLPGVPNSISASEITQLSLLVGDKDTTPFTLQIKSIKACNSAVV